MDLPFCMHPFTYAEIMSGGDVFICCPGYLKPPRPIGNLAREPLLDLWNSPRAEEFRQAMHTGDWSRTCDEAICPMLLGGELPRMSEGELVTPPDADQTYNRRPGPRVLRSIQAGETRLPFGPRYISFAADPACNLSCPSCRAEPLLSLSRKADQELRLLLARIREALPHVGGILFSGDGDPFFSKPTREFLESIRAEDCPDLTIDFLTNGICLTPKVWKRMQGLWPLVGYINVSVDAGCEETYSVVRRGGAWRQLMASLEFIRDLRRSGGCSSYRLNFTVSSLNYRDIPAFVELGRALQVDDISFARARDWGVAGWSQPSKDVCDPAHPEHSELVRILAEPALSDSRIRWRNLQPIRSIAAAP